MKEKPILFSGAMVRAILENRKTQTRRVVKPQPPEISGLYASEGRWYMPPGEPADIPFPSGPYSGRLWVKETFRTIYDPATCREGALDIDYRADGLKRIGDRVGTLPWKPSIFMPRWASRLTLEIVSVKVERLQSISREDAIAEGSYLDRCPCMPRREDKTFLQHAFTMTECHIHGMEFKKLWDSINGKKYPWSSNCFVWVIEFKKL